MALWDVLSDLVHRDAQHLERIVIPGQNVVPASADAVPLQAGEGYFRLWVTEMFLQADREWFRTFYPVVQSLTTFHFGGGTQPVEVAQIAGPGHLQKLDPTNLDRVIQVDHTLTPLIPFAGGTVQVEAGLLAMQSDDLLQRFL